MFQILNKLTPQTVAVYTNEHFHITLLYKPSFGYHKHRPQPGRPTLRVANLTTLNNWPKSTKAPM